MATKKLKNRQQKQEEQKPKQKKISKRKELLNRIGTIDVGQIDSRDTLVANALGDLLMPIPSITGIVSHHRVQGNKQRTGDRNKIIATPPLRRIVKMLAAMGIPIHDIAAVMDMSEDSLKKHYGHEIATGKPEAVAWAARRLYSIGMFGTGPEAVNALKFYLATQGRWSTQQDVNHNVNVKEVPNTDRARAIMQLLALGQIGSAGPITIDGENTLGAESGSADEGTTESGG